MTEWGIAVAAVCLVWAIVSGLSAVGACQERSVTVNVVFLNIEMLRCLNRRWRLTCVETGRVGPLLYHFVIAINVAPVLVLVLIVGRFA